ncbi:MAG TPA: GNAT family N-acetyltransferase [Gaiellaceae bacterium]
MKRDLGDGYELDDDRARIDVAAVHRYLSQESYWAQGRSFDDVSLTIEEATRVVGLYKGGEQIGFCRAARCAPTLFYLADVYVLDGHRGHGLGVELVREMVAQGPLAEAKWFLHTTDAHELYRKFGFEEPSFKVLERGMRPE